MGTGSAGQTGASAPLHVRHDVLSLPAQENHIVQFYENEEFLADVVAHFVGVGLAAAEPTMIVATEAHRAAFARRLEAKGFEVARLCTNGQLVLLDARETLARFMVDGQPDRSSFFAVVGGTLDEIGRTSCHARMRAYGEMVDLLWADGNSEAAICLEELWNELAAQYSFSLLCAYDMARFPAGADGEGLERVCAMHSHVIPTERYAQLADPEARLREVAQLQQRARALENEIAERKRVEEQLRESLRHRDDFLAIAGHELKTPLTAAQLLLESLLRLAQTAEVPEMVQQRLGKANHSLERLGKVIEGVLDVTRLTAGPMALTTEELDLVALVREVVEPRALVAVSGDLEARGRWDRQRIVQVVDELVANAVKFSGGQAIEIHIERCADGVRLFVRDHGIGIAAADQARIFERFERVETPRLWGLGLGLWIARQAVEAHGGTIRVESELGSGATFIVELPYGA